MTYRQLWAPAALYVLGGIVAAAIVLTIWQPGILPFSLFACAFCWFVALVWPFPALIIDDDTITVRNPFSTTRIPYSSVTDITGGNHLAIEARGGMKVVASAVPGRGNFTVNALRKKDAYGSFFQPVTTVDDLRIDAGQQDTAATRIANIIRRRVELAPERTQPGREPRKTLNWATISVTLLLGGIFVAGLIIR